MKAARLRWLMNFWPPFMAAGIHADEINDDYRRAVVSLRARFYNRNYVGTHFGGSLFAMTDPFLMIMYMHNLGRDFLVWDQSAEIEFVAPGRGTVKAVFELHQHDLDAARRHTINGDKYFARHEIKITDAQNETVAVVRKNIYIRLKNRVRSTA